MFVLLMIVVLSVLALWLSNSERKHPVALIVVGVLSVVLGSRAAVLLSEAYATSHSGFVFAEEESPPIEVPASEAASETADNALDEVLGIDEPTEDAKLAATAVNATTLSVEPKASFRYLTLPRPEWVETEPLTADDRYEVAVESGLHLRKRTAQQALYEEVKSIVDKYVNNYLESEFASTLVNYSIGESDDAGSRTMILRLDGKSYPIGSERFDEQVEFDYGVMNQSHLLVKLDQDIQNALDLRWREVRATSRLLQTGLGGGALLLLLGTMFGYLKLDTATRGYYTGRLQFGAAAAILAIVAAGAIFANWIPWM